MSVEVYRVTRIEYASLPLHSRKATKLSGGREAHSANRVCLCASTQIALCMEVCR